MKYIATMICWVLGATCLYYYFQTGGTWGDLFVDFLEIIVVFAESYSEA